MLERLGSSWSQRLLRVSLATGVVLAVAGVLIDVAPLDLPLRLANAAGGTALAYLGGGLTMVAATSLAGHRLLAGEAQSESAPEGS